jgi:hypothetical protein
MPYKLIKHTDGSYAVKNVQTGTMAAKHTTLEKGKAQIRLLELIDKRSKNKK